MRSYRADEIPDGAIQRLWGNDGPEWFVVGHRTFDGSGPGLVHYEGGFAQPYEPDYRIEAFPPGTDMSLVDAPAAVDWEADYRKMKAEQDAALHVIRRTRAVADLWGRDGWKSATKVAREMGAILGEADLGPIS